MPTRLLFLLLLTAALFACSEKPQNLVQSERQVEDRDQTARFDSQRQRTLGQDEGNRVNNEGMLR